MIPHNQSQEEGLKRDNELAAKVQQGERGIL